MTGKKEEKYACSQKVNCYTEQKYRKMIQKHNNNYYKICKTEKS